MHTPVTYMLDSHTPQSLPLCTAGGVSRWGGGVAGAASSDRCDPRGQTQPGHLLSQTRCVGVALQFSGISKTRRRFLFKCITRFIRHNILSPLFISAITCSSRRGYKYPNTIQEFLNISISLLIFSLSKMKIIQNEIPLL